MGRDSKRNRVGRRSKSIPLASEPERGSEQFACGMLDEAEAPDKLDPGNPRDSLCEDIHQDQEAP